MSSTRPSPATNFGFSNKFLALDVWSLGVSTVVLLVSPLRVCILVDSLVCFNGSLLFLVESFGFLAVLPYASVWLERSSCAGNGAFGMRCLDISASMGVCCSFLFCRGPGGGSSGSLVAYVSVFGGISQCFVVGRL